MTEPIEWNDIHVFISDLQHLAAQLLRNERQAQSIHPTELLLSALRRQRPVDKDWTEVTWKNRDHFFRSIHLAMRRALIDHARTRKAKKRAAIRTFTAHDIQLDNLPKVVEEEPEVALALTTALDRLEAVHPQWAQLVRHRYYDGLSTVNCARMLGISSDTAKRWWRSARLVLYKEIVKIVNED